MPAEGLPEPTLGSQVDPKRPGARIGRSERGLELVDASDVVVLEVGVVELPPDH